MYLLKIKGSGKIPDYLQFRDDEFTLIAYFKADSFEKSMLKSSLELYIDDVRKLVNNMPFGEMKYINNK